jgi:ElaB/YqjD/DUF883 family membrane-anchored ribosome-binding protein
MAQNQARNGNGAASLHEDYEKLRADFDKLQDDFKALNASVGKLGANGVKQAEREARQRTDDVLNAGNDVAEELGRRVGGLERDLIENVREKPVTAVAAAAGLGFVLALLTR